MTEDVLFHFYPQSLQTAYSFYVLQEAKNAAEQQTRE